MAEAGTALMVAERLAPDNPMVRDLRNRINASSNLRSRLFYLGKRRWSAGPDCRYHVVVPAQAPAAFPHA